MKKHEEWLSKGLRFITHDIWVIPLKEIPRQKSFLIRQLRILVIAFRGYREGNVQLKASALTFYTILSVVPLIAMVFAIGKGFGIQDTLRDKVFQFFQQYKQVEGHNELINWVLDSADKFIQSASGGYIAGAGLVLLIWAVMQLLSHIETAFNDIWQIKKSRVFTRKLSDYLSIMLFAPIFLFLSSSFTYFVTNQFDKIVQAVPFLENLRFLLLLIPYILVWLLLTMVYMVMPNTKVNFSSALIAAVIAGTAFQVTQWIYIQFQVGITRYGALYGSFAAIPLFIIWIQTSWLIILTGAEISFANQNVSRYEFETESLHVSTENKRSLTLLIAQLVVKQFENGAKPLTASLIANQLKVPIRLVREIIYELVEAGIFVELATEEYRERAYQPALDINKISVTYVIDAVERHGTSELVVTKNADFQKISDVLHKFHKGMEVSPHNKMVKDL
jgi:membrane protein